MKDRIVKQDLDWRLVPVGGHMYYVSMYESGTIGYVETVLRRRKRDILKGNMKNWNKVVERKSQI
jgi:hypothetical protein